MALKFKGKSRSAFMKSFSERLISSGLDDARGLRILALVFTGTVKLHDDTSGTGSNDVKSARTFPGAKM